VLDGGCGGDVKSMLLLLLFFFSRTLQGATFSAVANSDAATNDNNYKTRVYVCYWGSASVEA
jgi:hypothetical protein